jgi:hypothetical protein
MLRLRHCIRADDLFGHSIERCEVLVAGIDGGTGVKLLYVLCVLLSFSLARKRSTAEVLN